MELLELATKEKKELEQIKSLIIQKLLNYIPQDNEPLRLNNNCFVVKFSTLFEKGNNFNLSPRYYDTLAQRDALTKFVESAKNVNEIALNIKTIVDKGFTTSSCLDKIMFNPLMRQWLKETFLNK